MKAMKWIVALIVIIGAGWYAYAQGWIPGVGPMAPVQDTTQSAAVQQASSDEDIVQGSAQVDAQLQAIENDQQTY